MATPPFVSSFSHLPLVTSSNRPCLCSLPSTSMSDRIHHRSRSPALWVRASNDTTTRLSPCINTLTTGGLTETLITVLVILSVTLSLVALLVAIPPNSSPLRSGLIGTNASPPSSPVTTTIVFPPSPPPASIIFQGGGSSSPHADASQALNSLVASLNAVLARSDTHDLSAHLSFSHLYLAQRIRY